MFVFVVTSNCSSIYDSYWS